MHSNFYWNISWMIRLIAKIYTELKPIGIVLKCSTHNCKFWLQNNFFVNLLFWKYSPKSFYCFLAWWYTKSMKLDECSFKFVFFFQNIDNRGSLYKIHQILNGWATFYFLERIIRKLAVMIFVTINGHQFHLWIVLIEYHYLSLIF